MNPEVRELISTPGPCITIVLGGNEAGDTAIELKGALTRIRKKLEQHGIETESLLAPVFDAGRDNRGETKSKGHIAILRAPSVIRVFRVGNSVKPIATVGERFDIRTLLAIDNVRKTFYILALSQNRTRLLRCTEATSEEIPIPGAPASLADSANIDRPDHVLDNSVTAGPSMGAGTRVMFGTSKETEARDEYLVHFFLELDRAVVNALRGCAEPLIPAGVDNELAMYRRINTWPHLVEPGISGAPDGLEGGEMHRRGLELLDRRATEMGAEVPADFDKRVGTGHASTHVQEIITATWEGRVSHLFFQSNATYVGTFDPVRHRVKHTDDPTDSPTELIDSAAEQTVLHGGMAKILPASAMPNGVPVCALMRYPSVQRAAGGEVEAA